VGLFIYNTYGHIIRQLFVDFNMAGSTEMLDLIIIVIAFCLPILALLWFMRKGSKWYQWFCW